MPQYPWFQHYPPNVPATIFPEHHESFVALLEEALQKFANAPMYESMGRRLTYKEVDQLTQAFAAYLQHYTKLQQGDHIAIQLPNLLQYPIAMLGALRAGLVVVNVNPLYTPYEMAYQLKDASAKGIVILANYANNLEKILHQTDIQSIIITKIGDLLGILKGRVVDFSVRWIKRLVPRFYIPGAIMFKKVLREGATASFKRVRLLPNQSALLQYTGGTTGVAKGVVLTHRNIVANVEQTLAFAGLSLQEGSEIIITPLPLYHSFSLTANLLLGIRLGAIVVLILNPRDFKAFVKELKKHRFTYITGVNRLFSGLLKQKQFASLDFSSLKAAIAGGVVLQDTVAQEWEKITKVPLLAGYGLTEASPIVTCNPPHGNHRGTVGMPLPSTLVRIVDDEGRTLGVGQPGHLHVKGPQVMEGYWEKPLETAKVLQDGWLITGDLAVMTAQGYIKIVGRHKEMINISGFNVYPSEIEAVIENHPQVSEAGAIGILDEEAKEVIKLFIVSNAPNLTSEEVIAYCREYLTSYKVPKYVEFRAQLPKSHIGKIIKSVLQEEEIQKNRPIPGR